MVSFMLCFGAFTPVFAEGEETELPEETNEIIDPETPGEPDGIKEETPGDKNGISDSETPEETAGVKKEFPDETEEEAAEDSRQDESSMLGDELPVDPAEGDYTCTENDDGTWTITKYTGTDTVIDIPSRIDGKSVTVIGEGAFADQTSITAVYIPDSVTKIGAAAFSGCTGLSRLSVPAAVTSMKRDSLEGCSGLKSAGPAGSGADYEYGWTVSIPAYAFSGCTGLTNIAFPEGLQEIRGGAFTDCAGLKELPLPSSVKFVGSGHLIDCTSLVSFAVPDGTETLDTTFMGCTSLNTVTIPVSVKLIDMYTFDGVPNGLTVIYKGSAFDWDAITISKAGNTVLDSAEIIYESGEESYVTEDGYRYTINDDIVRIIGYEGTDSVLSIPAAIEGKWVASVGGKGFRGNKNITEITIGEGIEELDPYAFSACKNLKKVVIPSSMYSLSQGVFGGCESLEEVRIPLSLGKIEPEAFSTCSSLKSLTLPDGLTSIGTGAFQFCSSLQSIQIPKEITRIPANAFYGCKSLGTVTFPEELNEIGLGAFGHCESLTLVSFPEKLVKIGDSAFMNCSSLREIELPYSISELKSGTFRECTGLERVSGAMVTKLEGTVFSGCTNLKQLYFPLLSEMDEFAFNDCTALESLESFRGDTIPTYAFANCTNLKTLYLGNELKFVGEGAFKEVPGPLKVYFYGTMNEWNAVAVGAENDALKNAEVNLLVPVSGISLNKTSSVIYLAETEQLTASVLPAEASNKKVFWTTSSTWVAAVNSDGTVAAGNEGTAVITAISEDGGFTAQCEITVTKKPGPEDPDYDLTENPDGTLAIEKYKGSAEELSIPSEISGKKVKVIQYRSFTDHTELKKVIIPGTVTEIHQEAFAGCVSLETLILPAGTTSLWGGILDQCTRMKTVGPIGSDANIQIEFTETFPGIYSDVELFRYVTKVTVPEGVKALGNSALAYNHELTDISLPDSLISIGNYAFAGCGSLAEITIPDGVTSIGRKAFMDCSGLEEIHLPSSLESLGNTCFLLCPKLEKITIPDGMTEIGRAVFEECTGLREIHFGSNIQTIGARAFLMVPEGLTVVYGGTEEEWHATAIAEEGNESLLNSHVVYHQPVTGITVDPLECTIYAGRTASLSAVIEPADAADQNVTWSSDREAVAAVDYEGRVIGKSEGEAVITVTTEDGGFTAQCKVTVLPAGIFVEGLLPGYAYTGSAVKPLVQVFDCDTLLTEKTDYTVSYKDNTKAGTASLTVTGKGNYSMKITRTFEIDPVDINEAEVEAITLVQSSKPAALKPKVTWFGKALKEKTDYTIDASGLDQTRPGEYPVFLTGTGSFDKDTRKEITVTVVSAADQVPVTKLKVNAKAVNYETIKASEDKFPEVLKQSGFTVMDGKTPLVRGVDYEIMENRIANCDRAGTCTFVIKGKEDTKYGGERTVLIRINGTPISKAKVSGSVTYDGTAKKLNDEGLSLTVKSGKTEIPLTEGEDYRILVGSYENNINAGKAAVMVEGLGGYSGTGKMTFTINPDTGKKTMDVKDTVYAKGGAIPEVTVMSGDTVLREGRDYRLSFKDNKKAGKGSAAVTFLGNYKGSTLDPLPFTISPKSLKLVYASAADLVWKNKAGNYKAKITIADTDGKKLSAGSDYDKNIVYKDEDGKVLDAKAIVPRNSTVTAVITGKGYYEDSIEITYKISDTVLDLSKANIKVGNKEYTGDPIVIEEKDITEHTIKIGKETKPLNYGEDYRVLYYENNVKKGTAKVTFIGMGSCSGLKTVSFKIVQRSE